MTPNYNQCAPGSQQNPAPVLRHNQNVALLPLLNCRIGIISITNTIIKATSPFRRSPRPPSAPGPQEPVPSVPPVGSRRAPFRYGVLRAAWGSAYPSSFDYSIDIRNDPAMRHFESGITGSGASLTSHRPWFIFPGDGWREKSGPRARPAGGSGIEGPFSRVNQGGIS